MADSELFKVEYTVESIRFKSSDNSFVIFDAKKVSLDPLYDKDVSQYTIKGYFDNISENDSFFSMCEWVMDKKYGWQLQAKASQVVIPSNANGIKHFLTRFVKGIGKANAKMIVQKYGLATLDKIKEGPHNLTCFRGIGQKKAEKIYSEVIKHDYIERLSVYLFSKGVKSYYEVVDIYETLGNNALDMIIANPYCLCEKLGISKFPLADTIALNSGIDKDSDNRFMKIIQLYVYVRAYHSGDLFVRFSNLEASLTDFMRKSGVISTTITESRLKEALDVLEQQHIIKQEIYDGDINIYLMKLYEDECLIADTVSNFCKEPAKTYSNDVYERFFANYEKKTGFELGEKQKLAIKNTAEHKISILTGGAGTGKTQTVNAIIQFLKSRDKKIEIALVAPTGRAAKRMNELTNMPSSTIHKFLGLVSEEIENFVVDVDNSNYDFLICDECSMIDAPLFAKLLKHVSEHNMGLLLVGDKEQLAPVGPGLIFRDLVESGLVSTVLLDQLFRQAAVSQINSNANKILAGVTAQEGLDLDVEKQDFFFLPTKNAAITRELTVASIKRLLELGADKDDIMVLSPMRKTILGVIEYNMVLQELFNPASIGKAEITKGAYTYREGDRVMQEVNNYELDVFNGDIGYIKKIDLDKETVVIDFDGELKTYDFAELKQITLAYSITIHKSQGSEFPIVLMPCDKILINLSKNILYTSVTRARSRFVLIGDINAFYNGVKQTDNLRRNTNLVYKLELRLKKVA